MSNSGRKVSWNSLLDSRINACDATRHPLALGSRLDRRRKCFSSGLVSGRGALSFSLKKSLAHTHTHTRAHYPFVLPKRKCREATTGNGGSSDGDGDGSGSTEVSICSLGLVICVLDITARDLRCVPAISRTRARVSSPARLGSARRPFVSPSRVLSLPLSLRIRITKSFASPSATGSSRKRRGRG